MFGFDFLGNFVDMTITSTSDLFTVASPGPPLTPGFGGAFLAPVGGRGTLAFFDPARTSGTPVSVDLSAELSFVPSGSLGFPLRTKTFFTDSNGEVSFSFFGVSPSAGPGAATATVTAAFLGPDPIPVGGTVFTVTKPTFTFAPSPPAMITTSSFVSFSDVTTPPGFEFLVNWSVVKVPRAPFTLTRPLEPFSNGVVTMQFGDLGTYDITAHIAGTDPALFGKTVRIMVGGTIAFVLEDLESGIDIDTVSFSLNGHPIFPEPAGASRVTVSKSGPDAHPTRRVEFSFAPDASELLDPGLDNVLAVKAKDIAGNTLAHENTTLLYNFGGPTPVPTTSTGGGH
ncbi:hypothetical protein HY251_02095, partial [bacterium]|nr:hypothetical protein [bacterium]